MFFFLMYDFNLLDGQPEQGPRFCHSGGRFCYFTFVTSLVAGGRFLSTQFRDFYGF